MFITGNCQKKHRKKRELTGVKMAKDKQPPRTKKYYRPTEQGAGMTTAGVAKYKRDNPGSKLQGAVTKKNVKPGSKAANRRKSYCARSAGQMKDFPKAAKDPNSRLRQARKRWNCATGGQVKKNYAQGSVVRSANY